MFKDYDKAKRMLKGSFEQILGLMDTRYVSYDEVKELMVEALYELSKENEKVETRTGVMPQVLYGPPPMPEIHEVHVDEVEVHEYRAPQVLYGPPPMPEIHEVHADEVEVHEHRAQQVLYGPPPMGKVETRGEMADMFDDGYIPGTNIRKPRARKPGESEDQYLSYLEKYYATYLPNNGKGKGPRK